MAAHIPAKTGLSGFTLRSGRGAYFGGPVAPKTLNKTLKKTMIGLLLKSAETPRCLSESQPLFGRCGLQDRSQPRDLAPHQIAERLRTAPLRLGDLRAEIQQPLPDPFFVAALVEPLG